MLNRNKHTKTKSRHKSTCKFKNC